jgi:hypothetical protein
VQNPPYGYIADPNSKKMSDNKQNPIFTKDNYIWMAAGLVVLALGFFLLSGGASDDPNVFDKSKVYSTSRITVAPILILAGLVIEIFAIFRKPKAVHE